MFAEQWRAVAHFARRGVELDWGRRDGRVADTREVDLREEISGANMRIVERLTRRVDRARRHARGFEGGDGFRAGALGHPCTDTFADDPTIVAARLVTGETRIVEPLRCADQFRGAAEQRIAVHSDGDP